MKNTTYLFLLLLIWTPALSLGYLDIPQGVYESSSSSAQTAAQESVVVAESELSEVTRSSEPTLETASTPTSPERQQPEIKAPTNSSFFNPSYSTPSKGTKANKGEKLVTLKSCEPIRMVSGKKPSSGSGRCGDITIAAKFAPVLMKNLPICIAEGAKASGIQKSIRSTTVYNADSYSKRKTNSGRWSLHSTGRAFDIWQIDVVFEDGSTLKTPMTASSKSKPFYKKFNECWAQLIKKTNRCGYDGMIDCKDRNHRDHVHLSLPYCPRASGYSTI